MQPVIESLRGRKMACPYLVKLSLAICKARNCICKTDESPYTPSAFQLAEYCRSKDHKKCPFYLLSV